MLTVVMGYDSKKTLQNNEEERATWFLHEIWMGYTHSLTDFLVGRKVEDVSLDINLRTIEKYGIEPFQAL